MRSNWRPSFKIIYRVPYHYTWRRKRMTYTRLIWTKHKSNFCQQVGDWNRSNYFRVDLIFSNQCDRNRSPRRRVGTMDMPNLPFRSVPYFQPPYYYFVTCHRPSSKTISRSPFHLCYFTHLGRASVDFKLTSRPFSEVLVIDCSLRHCAWTWSTT